MLRQSSYLTLTTGELNTINSENIFKVLIGIKLNWYTVYVDKTHWALLHLVTQYISQDLLSLTLFGGKIFRKFIGYFKA